MARWGCPWFLPQEDGLTDSLRSWGGGALSPGGEGADLSVWTAQGRPRIPQRVGGLHSTLRVASKLPLASEVEIKGDPGSLPPVWLRDAFLQVQGVSEVSPANG